MSYSSYFHIAHKNTRAHIYMVYIQPGRYTQASWNLVGSKTFGVYLAKWRHPSWKWSVRLSGVALARRNANCRIFICDGPREWFAWRHWPPLNRRTCRSYFFPLSNVKWNPIRSGYIHCSRARRLYRSAREIRESGNARCSMRSPRSPFQGSICILSMISRWFSILLFPILFLAFDI